MRVMSRKASRIVDKLFILAGHDHDLVRDAIWAAASGSDSAPLDKVIDYIVARRRQSPAASL